MPFEASCVARSAAVAWAEDVRGMLFAPHPASTAEVASDLADRLAFLEDQA
jgi:hypothetical protein